MATTTPDSGLKASTTYAPFGRPCSQISRCAAPVSGVSVQVSPSVAPDLIFADRQRISRSAPPISLIPRAPPIGTICHGTAPAGPASHPSPESLFRNCAILPSCWAPVDRLVGRAPRLETRIRSLAQFLVTLLSVAAPVTFNQAAPHLQCARPMRLIDVPADRVYVDLLRRGLSPTGLGV